MKKPVIEICAGSLEDCLTADRLGISRVELNSDLQAGGLSPSLGTLKLVKDKTSLKVICMVRPRTGGFSYSPEEVDVMMEDARLFLENGADGIAFGFLNPDRTIQKELTSKMSELIHQYSKEAVFHRAFDLSPQPYEDLEVLIECGVDRLLTSGQASSAFQGIPVLKKLHEQAHNRIEILAGCGISAGNAAQIVSDTGISQIHASCSSILTDSACKTDQVNFSQSEKDGQSVISHADPNKITALIQSLESIKRP